MTGSGLFINTVTNEEIVNGLVSNGVSVVAVTDHDIIDVQMITELRNLGMPCVLALSVIDRREDRD